jgi:DNA-binding transcriptional ArsR family regulator
MSKATAAPERAVDGMLSVARLLDEPRLARLYTYVLREGEVTVEDIARDLSTPRTTAYSDTGTLVDLGLLTRDDSSKTHTYGAVPAALLAEFDGERYTITPTLIEAVARVPRDSDLELLVERHGVGKLAAALTYAVPYVEGGMTERVAARELDLQPALGIAVLQALREVVLETRESDPYFDRIADASDATDG